MELNSPSGKGESGAGSSNERRVSTLNLPVLEI